MLEKAVLKDGALDSASDAAEAVKEAAETVDYSEALDQIAQLLAYADLALLVIAVIVFLGVGVLVGHLVTRWMHGN